MKSLSLARTVLVTLVLVLARQETRAVQAHVVLTPGGTNFTYILFNDEAVSSHEYLNVLHLNPNAPFEVASTPPGWTFVTDNFSYVDWFCTNPLLAAPNDVAPGMSLGGFSLRSTVVTSEDSSYAVTSWYRGLTDPGSATQGPIQVPSIISAAFTNSVASCPCVTTTTPIIPVLEGQEGTNHRKGPRVVRSYSCAMSRCRTIRSSCRAKNATVKSTSGDPGSLSVSRHRLTSGRALPFLVSGR